MSIEEENYIQWKDKLWLEMTRWEYQKIKHEMEDWQIMREVLRPLE